MSGEKVNGDELWQDKDIRFDVDHRWESDLKIFSGPKFILSQNAASCTR
ncbi:unnamed protein product [Cylicostephanus goldi]|uniref:Uncharacterized protein n=1 Tax=Cylicostephanus goldi TaxID=71465 RepID=A0A3P6RP00_CYLGO|nr:unnamed protein product [Cylicostephanus goldi]